MAVRRRQDRGKIFSSTAKINKLEIDESGVIHLDVDYPFFKGPPHLIAMRRKQVTEDILSKTEDQVNEWLFQNITELFE